MKRHLFQKTEVLAVDLSTQNEAINQKKYEKDNQTTKLQARNIYGHCNMIRVVIKYSAIALRLYIQTHYQANKKVHRKQSSPS